jgi:integral membrane protein, TerC family
VWLIRGSEDALSFLTAYVIEKSLSIDNLFVFVLIFKSFHTPEKLQKEVLVYGVIGAIVMRGLFIWLGIELVTRLHFVIYIFGLFLIYSGIRFGMEKNKDITPSGKFFARFFRVTDDYVDDKFFIRKHAKLYATPLFLVLLSIETADLVFAIDSIPAVLAITYDPFIVYTSNIFAILGLRAHYFLLHHLLDKFKYLHYAISFILVMTGIKMIVSDFIKIPNLVLLLLIFTVLAISIGASAFKRKS